MHRRTNRWSLWSALVGALIVGGSSWAVAAPQDTVDTSAIAAFVERQMRRSGLPAVAVAVVRPDREVFAKGFTLAGAPLSPDAPFLLGSVTKTFTALVVAQLAEALARSFVLAGEAAPRG